MTGPRRRRRDVSFGSLLLGLLALSVVSYGAYRWTGRNEAAHERTKLIRWAEEFQIPHSARRQSAATVERDCGQGQPRRAVRNERSRDGQQEILRSLLSQAEKLGWTSDAPGLAVVGDRSVLQPSASLFRGGWELDVWLAQQGGATDVRLVVTTGAGGLGGCY